ncbi:MAG: LptF/LptG family permease [Spirochaetaceae bacterium]|nr:LptF/LptG family permease [Spirochaetaceae bacterium]
MAGEKNQNRTLVMNGKSNDAAAFQANRRKGGFPLILWNSLWRQVGRWTAGSTIFLALILSLAELFSVLWKFLARNANILEIAAWVIYGMPGNIINVLPVGFLFALSFTLAEWHANHELAAVFSAGLSLQRFLAPVVLLALILCGTEFLVQDVAAIPLGRARNELRNRLLQETGSATVPPALMLRAGRLVYSYSFFDEKRQRLLNPVVVERDAEGKIIRRISAQEARHEEGIWIFLQGDIYTSTGQGWQWEPFDRWSDPLMNEPPSSFTKPTQDARQMRMGELRSFMDFLRQTGIPVVEAQVEYHRRFSFLLTPLVVVGLAAAFAGRYRRSTFLISLVLSLVTATMYYVGQMLASLAARALLIDPSLALWSVMILFSVVSLLAFAKAKT